MVHPSIVRVFGCTGYFQPTMWEPRGLLLGEIHTCGLACLHPFKVFIFKRRQVLLFSWCSFQDYTSSKWSNTMIHTCGSIELISSWWERATSDCVEYEFYLSRTDRCRRSVSGSWELHFLLSVCTGDNIYWAACGGRKPHGRAATWVFEGDGVAPPPGSTAREFVSSWLDSHSTAASESSFTSGHLVSESRSRWLTI